jgi:hypothetical protein
MNTDMQNIESDEISLKELIEKGKEWFAYLPLNGRLFY